jgi:hypothetical protein
MSIYEMRGSPMALTSGEGLPRIVNVFREQGQLRKCGKYGYFRHADGKLPSTKPFASRLESNSQVVGPPVLDRFFDLLAIEFLVHCALGQFGKFGVRGEAQTNQLV